MLPFLIGKQQLHIGAGNYQGKILGEIQEETPVDSTSNREQATRQQG